MKSRMGFVSNSSSSSFVIVGANIEGKLNGKSIYDMKQFEDIGGKFCGLDVVEVDSSYADDEKGKTFVGKRVSRGSNEDCILDEASLSVEEIEDVHAAAKEKLEPLGLWDEKTFGVHCGTH